MENNFTLSIPSDRIEKDEKIDESIKRISRVLNILEATTESLSFTCKKHDWDEGVVFQIQEAATNLGYALATLNRWYDDYNESDSESRSDKL